MKGCFQRFRELMPATVEDIFTEHLLCARQCASSWGPTVTEMDIVAAFLEPTALSCILKSKGRN